MFATIFARGLNIDNCDPGGKSGQRKQKLFEFDYCIDSSLLLGVLEEVIRVT